MDHFVSIFKHMKVCVCVCACVCTCACVRAFVRMCSILYTCMQIDISAVICVGIFIFIYGFMIIKFTDKRRYLA